MTTSTPEFHGFSMLSQLAELRNAWKQDYPNQAQGGLLALSGFEYQFLLTLLKIIYLWKESTDAERQDLGTARKVLTEAISDITESGRNITFTQAKITLSTNGLRSALEELWKIFKLASEKTPDLAEHLRFVISGQFEGHENPQQVIRGWGTQSKDYPQEELKLFKDRVHHELIPDPRADLSTELQSLARDENTETTIARWLGYLLQLGSGFSPESISTFIWKELVNDGSIEAFRATLARLFSLSHSRLCAIRETLGDHITLPRAQLSDLRASLLEKTVTLLIGPSGSGKSALCKVGIQQDFKQNFDCLFLHASDIASFTESSDVIANRGLRRLDELLIARITQKPTLIVIDDLSDVDDQHFDAVLNLLQNTLIPSTLSDIRFILVAHVDSRYRINEKISARFGNNFVYADVELPQLPIEELESSEDLPDSITNLIGRHREFGPALNLKLIDWLVRSVQREQVDISGFRNDLDLLTWFWCNHVQNGQGFSDLGQSLIKIAEELANRFTPDLPCYFDSSIENEALRVLVRRDCLRIVDGRLATTHRFVGDCARFHYLRGNLREIESGHLVEWLQNPFWVQPIRWFALQLALESSEGETWQEFLCEALEGEHLQLLDLLLDGAILSKQPGSILQGCPDENLPFVIERLITRLLAIATEPHPFHVDDFQSTPLRIRITIQEQVTRIPKPDLWEPVWHWLLLQSPETVIEESCIVFRAAEAWLNWSICVERFPLRSEVAEFTLDLAQRMLLPDPDPQARIINGSELAELIKLRQQGVLPLPEYTRRKNYYLGDFSSNAFSCVVYALKIVPERSAWFLRVLAGREIVPANKLEPTKTSPFLSRSRESVLEPAHLRGPLGKVNRQFRKFALSRHGLSLDAVVRADHKLGSELILALTISEPVYRYEIDDDFHDLLSNDYGIEGSHDIDVCTFKFTPLISLLKVDEKLAIDVILTLCRVATNGWQKLRWDAGQLEGLIETDTNGVSLLINGEKRRFSGGRHALYWHRQYMFCPKILACFLMTLENWLYSLPTRAKLERSISILLQSADTVAILGVLVSLVKFDPTLLKTCLLPLMSSLQLLTWLAIEEIDRADQGVETSLDRLKVWGTSSEEETQELLNFHRLPHRKFLPLDLILQIWVEQDICSEVAFKILQDWDDCQIAQVPEESRYRALKIRTWFDHDNWQLEEDTHGKRDFRFIGIVPSDPEVDAKAEAALRQIQPFEIIMMCRRILNGELGKPLELHQKLVSFLTNEEKLKSLEERFEGQAFVNVVWAMITIILNPPFYTLAEEAEIELQSIAHGLAAFPIRLDHFNRCQVYDLNAEAFIAHVAPKLLRLNQAESAFRVAAFRCFVGARNGSTYTFMRSWIKEYGIEYPLTQQLINVAPLIARLISLTRAFAYAKHIQRVVRPDGSYIVPCPEEIDYEVSKREEPQIEEAWLSLQTDFLESKLQQTAIANAFEWTPEVLIQSIQQMTDWSQDSFIRHAFDWDFLTAALIPAIEARAKDDEAQGFIISLHEQVISALLQERENIYIEYKADQEKNGRSNVHIRLCQAQSQLLDKVIRTNHTNVLVQIDKLLHALKNFKLIDCILLGHVIDTLRYDFVDSDTLDVNNGFLISQIALAIGDYLFEFGNQPASDLRILGRISDVWEKLIELLSRESRVAEGLTLIDHSLVQFFDCFQEGFFPHWLLRKKLYHVAKLVGYKQFRRIIFQAIVQQLDLLPSNRNDESESLVQVLAELWDSDRTWITDKQSRCQDLRTLLGQLQEIDAVGARSLAEQVTNFLANSSN